MWPAWRGWAALKKPQHYNTSPMELIILSWRRCSGGCGRDARRSGGGGSPRNGASPPAIYQKTSNGSSSWYARSSLAAPTTVIGIHLLKLTPFTIHPHGDGFPAEIRVEPSGGVHLVHSDQGTTKIPTLAITGQIAITLTQNEARMTQGPGPHRPITRSQNSAVNGDNGSGQISTDAIKALVVQMHI